MNAEKPEDAAMAQSVLKLWQQVEDKVSTVLGTARVFLNGERDCIRKMETNLGNLITDCFSDYTDADICLVNGGGIRSSIATGPITVGDCLNVLPFDNYLIKLRLTGASLKKIFTRIAQGISQSGGFGGFLQVSRGMFVDYSQGEPLVKLNGSELVDDRLYTVCTTDFLAAGGDGLTGFTEAVESESTGKLTGDVFMRFIHSAASVAPATEGRIKLMHTVNKIKMPKGIIKNIPTPPRD